MATQTYYELLERLEAEATSPRPRHLCPVCDLTLIAVGRWLDLLSLENVNDIPTRQELRASGGFCPRHAYQWAAMHDALGTAIIYDDLLREVGKRIVRGEFGSARRGRLFGLGGSEPENPFAPCPVCLQQEEVEARLASEFADGYATQPRFKGAYAAEPAAGLCLPHFRRVVARLETPTAEELGRLQRAKFEATQAQLHQIIEKMDAARDLSHLTTEEKDAARAIGDERESLTRAVWQMVGLEGVG